MSEQIRDILFEYLNWIIFLPLILAVKNYKSYTVALKYVTWYLVLSAATQVISFALWKMSRNNYPILHVYTLFEYFVILGFYSSVLEGIISKLVTRVLLYTFLLFSVFDSLFIESIFLFNTYSRSIEALILITLAICWFIKIVGETEEERAGTQGINYINSGFFIYFSSSIIMFSYSSFIEKMSINSRLNVWTIHTFLVVQLYILIFIGLWKAKKTR